MVIIKALESPVALIKLQIEGCKGVRQFRPSTRAAPVPTPTTGPKLLRAATLPLFLPAPQYQVSLKGDLEILDGRSPFPLTLPNIWGISKRKVPPWHYPYHFPGTSFKGNDCHP